jgi:hypothetical protein
MRRLWLTVRFNKFAYYCTLLIPVLVVYAALSNAKIYNRLIGINVC